MRQDIGLTSFSAGELSPRLAGRTDIEKYFEGCADLVNFVVLPQGGVTRRPGTLYVATTQNPAYRGRIEPFVFSETQAYVLEFGELTLRIYADDGLIESGGVPVVVTTPYHATDLPEIEYVQSADTLFICHPSYPVQALTRSSQTSWAVNAVTFYDGPYLDVNTTATTLTPSATTGIITLTASAIVGINVTPTNSGQGFLATDVGRFVRIKDVANWGWGIITAVTSTTVVTVQLAPGVPNGAQTGLDGTAATVNWQLGKWCGTTGYPYTAAFWQQRLMLLGTNNQPNAVEGSVTGNFTNFAPTGADGVVSDINALSWIIDDDEQNAVN